MGRPTKLNERMIEKAEAYIEAEDVPFIEGLALELDVDVETMRDWTVRSDDLNKRFLRTWNKLRAKQKKFLQKGGLTDKDVKSNMAIFLLKANHGMIETERRELEVSGADGRPMVVQVMNPKSLDEPESNEKTSDPMESSPNEEI